MNFSGTEPNDEGMDNFLRRALGAPIPRLPADFDQRLMREVERSSAPRERYRQLFLTGYTLVSAGTCAIVMRGQGLDWAPIAEMILAPLSLVAVARCLWGTTYRKGAA